MKGRCQEPWTKVVQADGAEGSGSQAFRCEAADGL